MVDVIHEERASASHHMDVDAHLVAKGRERSLLRTYEWERFSVTSGVFSDPAMLLDLLRCEQEGVEIAKRPTGGGVLFHGSDIAFSLFFPMPLEEPVRTLCQQINSLIMRSLARFLGPCPSSFILPRHGRCQFCMSDLSSSDLLWGDKKIGGCALRKTSKGLLQQVSLFFAPPSWEQITRCVRNPSDVLFMQKVSTSVEEISGQKIDRHSVQEAIITLLTEELS